MKSLLDTANGCIIRSNVGALQRGTFYTIGNMLATLIVQGGELPRIFSNYVCQYIEAGFDGCKPTIEEVPDKTIRHSLSKVAVFMHAVSLVIQYVHGCRQPDSPMNQSSINNWPLQNYS